MQLVIRAAADRGRYEWDEELAAAWHGAYWQRVEARHFPRDLAKVLPSVRRQRARRPQSVEEFIERMDAWAGTGPVIRKDN